MVPVMASVSNAAISFANIEISYWLNARLASVLALPAIAAVSVRQKSNRQSPYDICIEPAREEG